MKLRIFCALILLFSNLFLPLWVSFILLILGVFYFDSFFEGFAVMFLVDLLYGVPVDRFFGFTLVSSFVALCIVILGFFLKKKLKFYQ
ncbi:MAG: hypothetical protein V4504_00220 [Patescibacteria group bacterium]